MAISDWYNGASGLRRLAAQLVYGSTGGFSLKHLGPVSVTLFDGDIGDRWVVLACRCDCLFQTDIGERALSICPGLFLNWSLVLKVCSVTTATWDGKRIGNARMRN